jgi:predicted transcriptional regulator
MPPRTSPDLPYLAPSEWQVFFVLSKRGPMTINEIGAELVRIQPDFAVAYTTILTYVQRLIRKGYVQQKRLPGPTTAHTYSTCVPYDFALSRQVARFLAEYTFGDPESLGTVRRIVDEQQPKPAVKRR